MAVGDQHQAKGPLTWARAHELWLEHAVHAPRFPRFLITLSFQITFLILRGITASIRYHWLPFLHNVQTGGGLHIHHFVWGILLLLAIGYVTIAFGPRRRNWLALLYGVAAALVLDEFALWLNLQDVYWAKQGRQSIDAAIVALGIFLLAFEGGPFLRAIVREVRRL